MAGKIKEYLFSNTVLKNIRQSRLFNHLSLYKLTGPTLIGVEPTNRCNLSCKMCSRNYWDSSRNTPGDMLFSLFKESIIPYTRFRMLSLQVYGEPLIAKDFLDMVVEGKRHHAIVGFTTNGVLLEKYADGLVKRGVDYIDISIDGIRELQRIRGVAIDVILRGIRAVNNAKHKRRIESPTLSINFVGMGMNIEELPDVIKLAKNCDIKKVNVVHLMAHDESLREENLFYHRDKAEETFRVAQRLAQEASIDLILPSLENEVTFCSRPFKHLYINWNGDIRPCCFATLYEDDSLILGNLNRISLKEIWLSPRLENLRKSLLTGGDIPAFCQKCPERNNSKESFFRKLK